MNFNYKNLAQIRKLSKDYHNNQTLNQWEPSPVSFPLLEDKNDEIDLEIHKQKIAEYANCSQLGAVSIACYVQDNPVAIKVIPLTDDVITIITCAMRNSDVRDLFSLVSLLFEMVRNCNCFDVFYHENNGCLACIDSMIRSAIPFSCAIKLLWIMSYLSSSKNVVHIETLFRIGFISTLLDLMSYLNIQRAECRCTEALESLPYIADGIDLQDYQLIEPALIIAMNIFTFKKLKFLSLKELVFQVLGISTSLTCENFHDINVALSAIYNISKNYFKVFWEGYKSIGFTSCLNGFLSLNTTIKHKIFSILQNIFYYKTPNKLINELQLFKLIKNILQGNDEKLLNDCLKILISISEKKDNPDIFENLLNVDGLMEILCNILENGNFSSKICICYIFSNILYYGDEECYYEILRRVDIIEPTIQLLSTADTDLVVNSVNLLVTLLEKCNIEEIYQDICDKMLSYGIKEIIDNILNENDKIYSAVFPLYEYFSVK